MESSTSAAINRLNARNAYVAPPPPPPPPRPKGLQGAWAVPRRQTSLHAPIGVPATQIERPATSSAQSPAGVPAGNFRLMMGPPAPMMQEVPTMAQPPYTPHFDDGWRAYPPTAYPPYHAPIVRPTDPPPPPPRKRDLDPSAPEFVPAGMVMLPPQFPAKAPVPPSPLDTVSVPPVRPAARGFKPGFSSIDAKSNLVSVPGISSTIPMQALPVPGFAAGPLIVPVLDNAAPAVLSAKETATEPQPEVLASPETKPPTTSYRGAAKTAVAKKSSPPLAAKAPEDIAEVQKPAEAESQPPDATENRPRRIDSGGRGGRQRSGRGGRPRRGPATHHPEPEQVPPPRQITPTVVMAGKGNALPASKPPRWGPKVPPGAAPRAAAVAPVPEAQPEAPAPVVEPLTTGESRGVVPSAAPVLSEETSQVTAPAPGSQPEPTSPTKAIESVKENIPDRESPAQKDATKEPTAVPEEPAVVPEATSSTTVGTQMDPVATEFSPESAAEPVAPKSPKSPAPASPKAQPQLMPKSPKSAAKDAAPAEQSPREEMKDERPVQTEKETGEESNVQAAIPAEHETVAEKGDDTEGGSLLGRRKRVGGLPEFGRTNRVGALLSGKTSSTLAAMDRANERSPIEGSGPFFRAATATTTATTTPPPSAVAGEAATSSISWRSGEVAQHIYDRKDMLRLRTSPLSTILPESMRPLVGGAASGGLSPLPAPSLGSSGLPASLFAPRNVGTGAARCNFALPSSLKKGGAGVDLAASEALWSSGGAKPKSYIGQSYGIFGSDDYGRGGGQNDVTDFVRPSRIKAPLPEVPEDSWQKAQERQKQEESNSDAKLMRRLRAQLNKMTPRTFESIYDAILSIGIETPEQAKQFTSLIFEKAITNHGYIEMYAMLCGKLQGDLEGRGVFQKTEEGGGNFKGMLLYCCQSNFNKNLQNDFVPPADANEEEQFELLLAHKAKMKGNLMFVGSLAHHGLLSRRVMIHILEQLVESGKPLQLEALAAFLPVVMDTLDKDPKVSEQFANLMHYVEETCEDEEVELRIRCLLKDAVEKRTNQPKLVPSARPGRKFHVPL